MSRRPRRLDRADVDTDQSSEAIHEIERDGFGEFLLFDWRYDDSGEPRPDLSSTTRAVVDAKILITGANFGCGSSREHAAWSLQDHGFDVLIAPSFGDIFRSNCLKIGLVPIELPAGEVAELMESARGGGELTVDLERQEIARPDGVRSRSTSIRSSVSRS